MSTMAKKADLPEVSEGKRLTNTSIRKRLCQKLLTANVPDTQAIHITGHKNSDSLNNYRKLNNHQQRNISNILANTSTGPAPPPQRSNPSTMPTSMTGPAPPPQTFNPSIMPTSMTGPAPPPPPQTFNHSTMPTSMSMTEHGKIQQSLVYTQSRHKSHVSKSSGTELVSGLFQNATITGGVFNITILSGKRKREATIDSDEECLIASQDY